MTSGSRFKVRKQVPGFSSSSYIEGPGSCVPLKMSSKWCGRTEFPMLHTIMTKQPGGKAYAVSDSTLNVAAISVLSFFLDLAVSTSALICCGIGGRQVLEKKGGRRE